MTNPMKPAAEIGVATILLAALVSMTGLALTTRARAAESTAFAIPAEDGYGIAECMQAGSACGTAMADSWCEAHGRGKSLAFGLGGDVTGAIPADSEAAPAGDEVLIRCGG